MYQAEDRISGSDGKIFARLKKWKKLKHRKVACRKDETPSKAQIFQSQANLERIPDQWHRPNI